MVRGQDESLLISLLPESPAEKLRNVLALLRAHERLDDELADIVLDQPCYVRIALLVAEVVDELEQPATPAPRVVHCRYCACTEQLPCSIDIDELAPSDRDTVAGYFAESRLELPDRVTCWWISLDPAVCCNPHCAELHRATGTSGVSPS